MNKFKIPKRVFMQGERVPITLRIPTALRLALEEISKDKGRNFTDLVLTVLDQYAQQETKPDDK